MILSDLLPYIIEAMRQKKHSFFKYCNRIFNFNERQYEMTFIFLVQVKSKTIKFLYFSHAYLFYIFHTNVQQS